MVQAGSIAPLRFEFAWAQDAAVDADEGATGELRLFAGNRLIWGRSGCGVSWHWTDLLEGLSANWGQLLFGGWLELSPPPRDSALEGLEALRQALDWKRTSGEISEGDALEVEELAYEWQETHLLSRFMPGMNVPDVCVWASGKSVVVETSQFKDAFPREVVAATLTDMGDAIAERLRGLGFADHDAVASWASRSIPPSDEFASTLSGVPAKRLAAARGALPEAQAWGGPDGEMAETACTAAAAACRSADFVVLQRALVVAAGLQAPTAAWTDCLDKIWRIVQVVGRKGNAFDLELAATIRGSMGLDGSAPMLPRHVAEGVGVQIVDCDLGSTSAIGIALGAPGLAPAILLNTAGLTFSQEAERRWIMAVGLAEALRSSLAEAPWATLLGLQSHPVGEDLALELLVPNSGLEDFVLARAEHASYTDRDLIQMASAHYGAPPLAVALQLRRSSAVKALPSLQRQVDAVIKGDDRTPTPRHVRPVKSAA